jgi:hypothetical protein
MNFHQFLKMSVGSLFLGLSALSLAQTAKKVQKPVEKPLEEAAKGMIFPDWNPETFDWGLGPIAGVRARQTEFNGIRSDTISSEFGLGVRIQGVPIVPGNPGLTMQPYASYTWGNRTEKLKEADLSETETSGFQRSFYGVVGRFYYNFFRYSLDLGTGQLNHDKDYFIDVKSQRIINDVAVLILPFLSAHYTLTHLTVTLSGDSKPSIAELDHWLHGRVAFSLFDSSLEFGPGMTSTQYSGRASANAPFAEIASVNTQYLKALAALHIFWKLGASGSAKYIVSGEDRAGLNEALEQLPHEGLAQRNSLDNLPNGSLEASAFFGIKNLFGGIGVGWQYYYLEENTSPKQIARNQGFALVYEGGF